MEPNPDPDILEIKKEEPVKKESKLFYRFPFIGLSAEVVKLQKMKVLKENPRGQNNYLEDIDNLSGISNLKNLIIGPIKHNGKVIAVLQVCNKDGDICKVEEEIMESLLETLGIVFHTNQETS